MPKIEGNYCAAGLKVAIITARFNETITYKLTEGSIDCLVRHGASADDITEVLVPGAFEIIVVAEKLASSGKYDVIICNGAVIKGETPHFDVIVSTTGSSLASLNSKYGVPVVNGILTTNDIDQAFNRAGIKGGNKGWDHALGAIETANVLKQL